MSNVSVTKSINVSADKAWQKIVSFRGIENFSPIERSVVEGNGEGATRTCFMPDGASINEVLSLVDQKTMKIQYKITEGPFPITDYLSTVNVSSLGEGKCEITWAAEYDVEPENKKAMDDLFSGFYHVIIDSLENLINSEN